MWENKIGENRMESPTIMSKPTTGGFTRGLNHQRKLARSVKMIEAKTIPMGLQRGLAYKKILSEQVADLAKSLNIPAAGSVKNFNILNLFKILR